MLFGDAKCTNSIVASLAVGVDFHADMFLTAGNPLHGGISRKGLLKGDLLVSRCGFAFLVPLGAAGAKILAALHTVHGRILDIAEVAINHPVYVSLIGLGGLDQGVDEGIAGE